MALLLHSWGMLLGSFPPNATTPLDWLSRFHVLAVVAGALVYQYSIGKFIQNEIFCYDTTIKA